ncbi:unnamed protein product [Trifolium pratense]|uniref:Uncharacterized protein n=1 Tax=Trifolium pratense TaxID=57577 RepID=A0ACB0K0Z9_TRIPR|nr:unnamed protein product [Trifolium pratense]
MVTTNQSRLICKYQFEVGKNATDVEQEVGENQGQHIKSVAMISGISVMTEFKIITVTIPFDLTFSTQNMCAFETVSTLSEN